MPPLAVLLNRKAGTAPADEERVVSLFGDAGAEARIHDWRDIEQVAQGHPQLVVAAGGDGTVNAVASVLAGTDIALGVLPLGTLNHFARDIGMPLDLQGAARAIVAGKRRAVDV